MKQHINIVAFFLLVRRNLEKISQNLNALICTMTKDEVEEYYKRTKDEA